MCLRYKYKKINLPAVVNDIILIQHHCISTNCQLISSLRNWLIIIPTSHKGETIEWARVSATDLSLFLFLGVSSTNMCLHESFAQILCPERLFPNCWVSLEGCIRKNLEYITDLF